jgi:hypothetical protein
MTDPIVFRGISLRSSTMVLLACVPVTVEVRSDRSVIALKDLICVIRLVSHGINLAKGHVSDWTQRIVCQLRRPRELAAQENH